MSRDGCKHCPGLATCPQYTYRGSDCSAWRHRFGVGFDPISRGEAARMSNEALAKFFCDNTDCMNCKLYDHCDSSKEYPLLEYLEEAENQGGHDMLIHHVHAKVHRAACTDGRFIPGIWYPITDGLMLDELGTRYEDVRSLEALANLFPNAAFDHMVAEVETY